MRHRSVPCDSLCIVGSTFRTTGFDNRRLTAGDAVAARVPLSHIHLRRARIAPSAKEASGEVPPLHFCAEAWRAGWTSRRFPLNRENSRAHHQDT